jgi:hypothetical protein
LRSSAATDSGDNGRPFSIGVPPTLSDARTIYIYDNYFRDRTLAATSLNGVVQELRPTDIVTDAPDLVSAYAGWLLGILLALRQHPAWIYGAIETIGARAVQREQQARNDAWTARILDRS